MNAQEQIQVIRAKNLATYNEYKRCSKEFLYQEICRRVRINALSETSPKYELLSALVDAITDASRQIRRIEKAEARRLELVVEKESAN